MIRLGTQDDLQQIDIFDEFGGDRIQEIKENRLTIFLIAHQVIQSLISQNFQISLG
jgi:hypothetical protein